MILRELPSRGISTRTPINIMNFRILTSSLTISLAAIPIAAETPPVELVPVTVVAHATHQPLWVDLDPKTPAQPIPAQDGAEILLAIPGFNTIRKGGVDGDPVFRGMAGSRLVVSLDGQEILGGCGNRMDPPTAYVFPSAFDRVTVIKGPQSVLHGPGNSAATVLFERDLRHYSEPDWQAHAALVIGAHGRNDQLLDANAGNERFQARATLSRSASDDYRDGNRNRIHSQYERWIAQASAAWTPSPVQSIEISSTFSDGEAAYADRAMDGTKFARRNIAARALTTPPGEWIESVEISLYYNYVDHVMDNHSLRTFTPTMMMPNPVTSNPDRETYGGRVAAVIGGGNGLQVTAGFSHQGNRHTTRRSMNEDMMSYLQLPRNHDASFDTSSVYSELQLQHHSGHRTIIGLRIDHWTVRDTRQQVAVGMMATAPNPTAGQRRSQDLLSGFLRHEIQIRRDLLLFAGIGHTGRFPDYWELFNKESADSLSAFNARSERTTQLDVGASFTRGNLNASLSLFANRAQDYLLIESGYMKPHMGDTRGATITRNIDSSSIGAEFSASYRWAQGWRLDAGLAGVRGSNRSDDLPLAQQPPLEARIGFGHHQPRWSVGALIRAVQRQSRVAPGQGNIVGQDIEPSAGFVITSLHASLKIGASSQLAAGIDNLFNRHYAEHLSRGGSMVAGFPPPETRVQEPGRTWWLRLETRF